MILASLAAIILSEAPVPFDFAPDLRGDPFADGSAPALALPDPDGLPIPLALTGKPVPALPFELSESASSDEDWPRPEDASARTPYAEDLYRRECPAASGIVLGKLPPNPGYQGSSDVVFLHSQDIPDACGGKRLRDVARR
ncbi:hypothetical protein HK107_05570 [Parvularcula sp. ZS-1/3]|uniref:Uncharacterized protein n=1 Tax=Parvularcula mediterranea TaxID=2732508 RepID=A0A7Y3W4S6_9PROT|nr:hypothetical protein [Parvularcula mediterranea]NNU15788.1 hypothetical protein [Parvularcula mediterranea]